MSTFTRKDESSLEVNVVSVGEVRKVANLQVGPCV